MGNGTDFDWRKYAVVKGAELTDDAGLPFKNVSQDLIDYNAKTLALTEKVMDQLSATPEFQKKLLESAENGTLRLLEADNQERLVDPRLVIRLNPDGHIGYDASGHEISIGLKKAPLMAYGDPPQPFSLQRMVYHEVGHAADPDLNHFVSHDLALKKEAFDASLKSTLARYPDYKELVDAKDSPFANNIEEARNAKTPEEFDAAYNKLVDGNTIRHLPEVFDDPTNERLMALSPEDRAMTYLNSSFKPALDEAIMKKDELPVVSKEDEFMAKYFGEKPRKVYEASVNETDGNHFDPNYKVFSDTMSQRVHTAIDPASGIKDAPTIPDAHYMTVEKLLEPLKLNVLPQFAPQP